MKADVVVTRAGEISIFTREGNFEAGKAKILELLMVLGAQGIEIETIGDVEQHRHASETVAVEVREHERGT